MLKLTSQELRTKWISFFQKHGHYLLPPASLIPHNDPSLLFINSGVATIKPYFVGQIMPPAKRLVNCQKVIRTNDIENVGKNSRHNTFFEMLGNFSVGDYFKQEAITLAYQFLTQELKIAPQRLYFTVLKEDSQVYNQWIALGVQEDHIFQFDRSRNFWDMGYGPCGSCTEIFYDRLEKYDPDHQGLKLLINDIENDRFIEIWNIVFSEFNNDGQNNYTELAQKNIDTGAGFERLLTLSQDVPTNFDTDLFSPIIKELAKYSFNKYREQNYFAPKPQQTKINEIYRIIVDHLRAIVTAISDGCVFGPKGRESILRKLMRRIIALSKILPLEEGFLLPAVDSVISNLSSFYPDLITNQQKIKATIEQEFILFTKTLAIAWKKLTTLFEQSSDQKLDSYQVFKLVETYGFAKELLDEVLVKANYHYDQKEFDQYLRHHQMASKGNQDVVVMEAQNKSLLLFQTKSIFNYQVNQLTTKVIGLFNAKWEKVDYLDHEDGYVILQETCLYARLGGQEADHGFLNDYQVTNVIKGPNEQNVHEVHQVSFTLGQQVMVVLDQGRRKQLQQHHSAAHLVHAALKTHVDPQIKQEGAHKDVDKLTLDFRHHQKLTNPQIEQLEQFIFHQIAAATPVVIEMVELAQAQAQGASAYFEDKYKKLTGLLRMVKIGQYSTELCGGTHVANTAEIEDFLILSCKQVSAGVWRIEAIAGHELINHYLSIKQNAIADQVSELSQQLRSFGVSEEKVNFYQNQFQYRPTRQNWRNNQQKLIELQIKHKLAARLYQKQSQQKLNKQIKTWALNNLQNDLVHILSLNQNYPPKMVIEGLNNCFTLLNHYPILVVSELQDKTQYYLAASKEFWTMVQHSAKEIVGVINKTFGGMGGGRKEVAQGSYPAKISLAQLVSLIEQQLWPKK